MGKKKVNNIQTFFVTHSQSTTLMTHANLNLMYVFRIKLKIQIKQYVIFNDRNNPQRRQ